MSENTGKSEESTLAFAKELLANDRLWIVKREYSIVHSANIYVIVGFNWANVPFCASLMDPIENDELRQFLEEHEGFRNDDVPGLVAARMKLNADFN